MYMYLEEDILFSPDNNIIIIKAKCTMEASDDTCMWYSDMVEITFLLKGEFFYFWGEHSPLLYMKYRTHNNYFYSTHFLSVSDVWFESGEQRLG